MDLSKNKISKLPSSETSESETVSLNEDFWDCPNLKMLKLSRNLLTDIPKDIQGAKGLQKLCLDGNRLTSFETVWSCPLVNMSASCDVTPLHHLLTYTQLLLKYLSFFKVDYY